MEEIKKIQIKIPFKTPTVNHLYFISRWNNMRIITAEAKKLKEEIRDIIQSLNINTKPYQDQELDIIIEIHEDWYTKKGKVKQKDIANREKFLVDAVFQYLELDDRFIFNHKMIKVQDNEEYAIIKVTLSKDPEK